MKRETVSVQIEVIRYYTDDGKPSCTYCDFYDETYHGCTYCGQGWGFDERSPFAECPIWSDKLKTGE
jgi:hypothetical protein